MTFGILVNGKRVNLLNEDPVKDLPLPVLEKKPAKKTCRQFICKTCSQAFTCSGHLIRHERIHTGAKPFECPIPTCSSRFSRHDNMMQHYRTHVLRIMKDSKFELALLALRQEAHAS